MLFRLLTLPVSGPLWGLTWLGEKILERADAELDSKENLNKRLLALQLALDLDEISEDDYDAQEEVILLELQAIAAAEAAGELQQ